MIRRGGEAVELARIPRLVVYIVSVRMWPNYTVNMNEYKQPFFIYLSYIFVTQVTLKWVVFTPAFTSWCPRL